MKRHRLQSSRHPNRTTSLFLLACLALFATASAKTFTGRAPERCNPNDLSEEIGNGDDWNHPKNWGTPCDPVPPPSGGDTAVIPAGFTVRAQNVSVGELTVEGTLILSGSCSAQTIHVVGDGQILSGGDWKTLTVGSLLVMEGNTIGMNIHNPAGTVTRWKKGMIWGDVTQDAGALMFIEGGADHLVNACTFHLNGVTTWSDNGKILQGGYYDTTFKIINAGTFLANGSGTIESGGYYTCHFMNEPTGEFIKAGGSSSVTSWVGGATFRMIFYNKGTINAESGVFDFAGGCLSLENGGTLKGSGTARVSGGLLQFPPGTTSTVTGVLELAGGYLEGDATMTGDGGTFNWTGGTIGITQGPYEGGRAATLNIPDGMTLNILGDADKRLGGAVSNCGPCHRQHGVINNAGTANWTGAGDIYTGYGGGEIVNSGTFRALNDEVMRVEGDGGAFTNTSTGILRKETGTGETIFQPGIALLNGGTVDVRTGVVQANGALNLLDGSRYSGAGLLKGNAGGRLVGTATVAAGGTVELNGGNVGGGDGTIFQGTFATEGDGRFNWAGGALYGTINVAAGSTLSLTGPDDKYLGYFNSGWDNSWLSIYNAGTISWTGGNIVDRNTGRIYNSGTFLAANTGNLGVNEFHNTGTLAVGAGQALYYPEVVGLLFNTSPGIIDVRAGELITKSMLNLDAGNTITGAGRLVMASDTRLNGTTHISGTLELRDGIIRSGTDAAVTTTGDGRFEWTKGKISGTLNILAGSRFDILGDGVKLLGHYHGWSDNAWGILNNYGTITWTGAGPINDENTGHLFNYGTMNVRTTAGLQNRLQNEGVLNLTQGGGIDFSGAYVNLTAAGTVNMELSDATGLAGRITSANNVTLGGTLNVTLAPGFQPVIGTSYPVVNRGVGQFSKFRLPQTQYFKTGSVEGGATTLTAEVSPQDTQAWKNYFFEDPESPLADLMADANGDGSPNLISYAFGKEPMEMLGSLMQILVDFLSDIPLEGNHAVKANNAQYMAVSYQRPGGNSKLLDVRYVPERSTTLAVGSWSTEGVVEESVTFDPVSSMETVVVRSTTPKGVGKEFLRVRVEQIVSQ